MHVYFSEIFYLFGEDRRKIPALVVLFIGSSLLDLVGIGLIGPYISLAFNIENSNQFINLVIELFQLSSDREQLKVTFGFLLISIFIIKLCAQIFVNYKIVNFGRDQQIRMRTHLMKSYQSLTYIDFTKRNSSGYIYSITVLVTQYTNQVVIPLLKTLSDGLVTLVIVIFLAWNSPLVLLALLCMVGTVVFGYDAIFRDKIKKYGVEANKAGSLMVKSVNEGISGLKELRILGKQEYFYNKLKINTVKNDSLIARMNIISSIPRYIFELVLICFIVSLIIVAILFEQDLNQLLPTLAMFGAASLRLIPAANGLSGSLLAIRYGRDSVSRLYKDSVRFGQVLKINEYEEIIEFKEFKELKLESVSFRYDNASTDILDNTSLVITSGESIGLVGPSGSGKSTLLNIILGLIPVDRGEVYVNNIMIKDVKEKWYKQVAYMPQQTFLIDDTVRANIALGEIAKNIDDDKLNKVIQQASLQSFIDALPQGVDTILGEGGIKISGGQRQRIALARAFYFDRNVLIMDESTSSLDNATEKEIIGEVKKLLGKKTMIVVAHRLSTVEHCDRILHLEKGKLVSKYSAS